MLLENTQTRKYPLTTRLLIACGAIGPFLFILMFLVEGAMRSPTVSVPSAEDASVSEYIAHTSR